MIVRRNVREVWDLIYPGLAYIHRVCEPEWRPEDIYVACSVGTAEVWMDPAHDDGFLILQEKPLSFEAGKALLVWIAYLEGGGGVSGYLDVIEEMARARGCKKVELWSPRKGMERLMSPQGYKIENVIFSKVIE